MPAFASPTSSTRTEEQRMTNNATLSAEAATSDADPTTVVITRFVKPGREEDYKRWLARLIAAAEDAPIVWALSCSPPNPATPIRSG